MHYHEQWWAIRNVRAACGTSDCSGISTGDIDRNSKFPSHGTRAQFHAWNLNFANFPIIAVIAQLVKLNLPIVLLDLTAALSAFIRRNLNHSDKVGIIAVDNNWACFREHPCLFGTENRVKLKSLRHPMYALSRLRWNSWITGLTSSCNHQGAALVRWPNC